MSSIIISPHDDDSVLFASFLSMREKPLWVIVTDSYIQPQRGEVGCEASVRADETKSAARLLGCPVIRLGLRDDSVTEEDMLHAFAKLQNFSTVYAPALQGGNPHHDMVSRVATAIFKGVSNLEYYTTYTRTQLHTTGKTEIKPTDDELALKYKALACYESQINLASTLPHFSAVIGKSEYLQ